MGIITWIILGVLVLIVASFLIYSTLKDRRTIKTAKLKKIETEEKGDAARVQIAIWMELVGKQNQKMITDFVPAIGPYKMSDIHKKAKLAIFELMKSDEFALAKASDKNKDLFSNLRVLYNQKSNNWAKNNQKEMDFFAKEVSNNKIDMKQFRKDTRTKIQQVYKNEPS